MILFATRRHRLSRGLRDRNAMRTLLILLLTVQMSGCAPVYRTPKKVDLFRVQPSKSEAPDQPIVEPKGVPLPDVPPPVDPSEMGSASFEPNAASQERPLSLEEAIRISLSNSGVVRVLSGSDVTATAATPYDPHIADARLRAAMAVFDPVLTSAVYSNWIDQPPDSVFGPGLAEPTSRDEAGLTGAVSKPWLSGGETRIGYNPPLGYLYIPNPSSGSLNPLYTSNLEFVARQPLLKGAGFGVNKAPIRIAQIRRDQSALETRQAVMASVRSVTEAYWELFAARNAAQVLNEVVPLLQRVAEIEHERMAAQRSVRADVAKAHSELHAVRLQLVELRGAVVQRELRLRNLLGLPPTDGCQIIPTSQPMQAPVGFDPAASIATAQENRPDLLRQQLAVRTRENELVVAKNAGLPQLDAAALYRWNGVGNALDDSLSQMFGTQYQDWQTSMTLSMPLGRRAGAAGIRAATLQLARERAMMQQALHAASHQITSLIQEAAYAHELFSEADARWQANTVWLEGSRIRYENPPPSGDDWLLAATNDYLLAVRSQADAARSAQSYLSRYNALLARINEARGTILFDANLDLVDEGRAAVSENPNPAGLPSMPPLPPAQSNNPPMVPPLMPLNELPPLRKGEPEPPPPLPSELNAPSPASPAPSLPIPLLPEGKPASEEVNAPPASAELGATRQRSSALFPSKIWKFASPRDGKRSGAAASQNLVSEVPENDLGSSADDSATSAKARAIGVHPLSSRSETSLIADIPNDVISVGSMAPVATTSPAPPSVATVRPITPGSSHGLRFEAATEGIPATAARADVDVGSPNLQSEPVRR
jgi:outer membrane protein TolC